MNPELTEIVDPIVVLGPPRSGTTMMAKILERTGVFMGYQLNNAFEDLFFVNVNEVMMDRLDITWDRPIRTHDFVPPVDRYLDVFAEADSWGGGGLRWGFKDPRTLNTWDMWERIFERTEVEPTVIRMERHPMDIALSLHKREKGKPSKYHHQQKPSKRSLDKMNEVYPAVSKRCLKLEGALDFAFECLSELFHDTGEIIEFEGLVTDPDDWLDRLEDILEMKITGREEIKSFMDESRALAFKDNPKAVEFWESSQS